MQSLFCQNAVKYEEKQGKQDKVFVRISARNSPNTLKLYSYPTRKYSEHLYCEYGAISRGYWYLLKKRV